MNLGDFAAAYRSPTRPKRWLALLTALSLANVCYLRLWGLLLFDAGRNYFAADVLGPRDYLAALGNLAILTGGILFLLGLTWRHSDRRMRAVGMIALLSLFVFPVDFLRRTFALGVLPVGSIGIALFAAAAWWRQRFFARLLLTATFLWPLAVFNILHCLFALFTATSELKQPIVSEEAASVAKIGGRRVFLIVFDEWDQSMLFERRPADLALPWLDELRSSSVTALNVWPPSDSTLTSIPSLLTGRIVASAQAVGDAELRVPGGEAGTMQDVWQTDSMVTDASHLGEKTAILGWYHPYGRLFTRTPRVEARSFGFPYQQSIRKSNLPADMLAQLKFLAYPPFLREVSIEIAGNMQREALAQLTDPSVGFGFFHYGIPHGPGIFDRRAMRCSSLLIGNADWYVGNLKLVDQFLGDLLAGLRKSGLDERTTLILTSDHWWRTASWVKPGEGYRIPLFIRFGPGEPAVALDETFSTVSLRPVIAEILAGKVSSQADLIAALRSHAIVGKITYVNGVAQLPPESAVSKPERSLGNGPN